MRERTCSASGKVISVWAAIARTFLNPLIMEWGTDATVGYPICKETEAMLRTPSRSRARKSSSVMSRIAGLKQVPLS